VIKILGEKTGAYEAIGSKDIESFRTDNLAKYDAVVLNNVCPHGKDRDVFRDVLINKIDEFGTKYRDMPLAEREALAKQFYRNLVDYVAEGGGLVALHGGIACFAYSDEFSDVLGGSFKFHPPQQDVTLNPVDPAHPLLQPFAGKPFVHNDEPYIFTRAYERFNFHPLLEMDTSKLKPHKQLKKIQSIPRYVSWVKRHGKGRVFYCSPSHNAQSHERPELLLYILGGIQYTLGDLRCDDTPMKQ
jgi:type 1 glutamine amidotransferase